MDNNSNNLTPQQQFEAAQQIVSHYQEQGQALNRHIDKLKEAGREDFGAAHFDGAIKSIADAVPNNVALSEALAESPYAPQIVMELGENEAALSQLSKMTPAQQRAYISRMETRLAPHGIVRGDEPDWRRSGSQRVSEENWRTRGGEGVDDKTWSRLFDQRQAKRFKEKRERGWG